MHQLNFRSDPVAVTFKTLSDFLRSNVNKYFFSEGKENLFREKGKQKFIILCLACRYFSFAIMFAYEMKAAAN